MFGVKVISTSGLLSGLSPGEDREERAAALYKSRASLIDEDVWVPSPVEVRYAELYPEQMVYNSVTKEQLRRYIDPENFEDDFGFVPPPTYQSRGRNVNAVAWIPAQDVVTLRDCASTEDGNECKAALTRDAVDIVEVSETANFAPFVKLGVEEVTVALEDKVREEYVCTLKKLFSTVDCPIAIYEPEPGLLRCAEDAMKNSNHALFIMVDSLPPVAFQRQSVDFMYVDALSGTIYILAKWGFPGAAVLFKSCCFRGMELRQKKWLELAVGRSILEEVETIDPGPSNLFRVLDDGLCERTIHAPWGSIFSFRRYEPTKHTTYSVPVGDYSNYGLLYILHTNGLPQHYYAAYVGMTVSGYSTQFPPPRSCVYPVNEHNFGRVKISGGKLSSYDYGASTWRHVMDARGGVTYDAEYFCVVEQRAGFTKIGELLGDVGPPVEDAHYRRLANLSSFGLRSCPPSLPGKTFPHKKRSVAYVDSSGLHVCDLTSKNGGLLQNQKCAYYRYMPERLTEPINPYPPYFNTAWRFSAPDVPVVDILRRYFDDYHYYAKNKLHNVNEDVMMRSVYLTKRFPRYTWESWLTSLAPPNTREKETYGLVIRKALDCWGRKLETVGYARLQHLYDCQLDRGGSDRRTEI